MRKTLIEALKWYKEKTALEAINSEKILENTGKATTNNKLVTIKVLDCKGIVSKLSKNPVPFFYYQFYSFDEHYSKTLNGPNPIFNDEMDYEVKADPQFKDYVTTSGLEIFLFDDNAPLIDNETNWDDITDMIGTALIDLTPILKGDKIDK